MDFLLASPLTLDGRVAVLILALLLDAAIGDPPWLWRRLPHPVVMFGWLINLSDRVFNRRQASPKSRQFFGIITLALLLGIAWSLGEALGSLGETLDRPASLIIEVAIVTIMLAGGSLAAHVKPVVAALAAGNLRQARLAISHIVGRNPKTLDAPAIARAAIETTAENMSDGVIAPALFYLLGGLPAMLVYKMLNTADSMLGHRTARHENFGWAVARSDDVANFIPARLTGILLALAALPNGRASWRGLCIMLADANKHASINAGWAEAAMAGVLNVRLAGARVYESHVSKDAPLNKNGKGATAADITRGLRLMWRGLGIFGLGLVALLYI